MQHLRWVQKIDRSFKDGTLVKSGHVLCISLRTHLYWQSYACVKVSVETTSLAKMNSVCLKNGAGEFILVGFVII